MRTKGETSEAYSEPYQITKMKLLAKIPKPKLLYTEAYSEDSRKSQMEVFANLLNGSQLLTIVFDFKRIH